MYQVGGRVTIYQEPLVDLIFLGLWSLLLPGFPLIQVFSLAEAPLIRLRYALGLR